MSVRGLNISLKIKVVTWQSSLWIQLPRRSWKSNTSPSSSPLWIAEKSCIFVFQDSNILCHKIGIFLISNDLTTLQSNQSIKTTVYNSASAYAQLCGIFLTASLCFASLLLVMSCVLITLIKCFKGHKTKTQQKIYSNMIIRYQKTTTNIQTWSS